MPDPFVFHDYRLEYINGRYFFYIDGILDLILHFDTEQVFPVEIPQGTEVLTLFLTGNLIVAFGGEPFYGMDVIVIKIPKGK